MYKGIVYLDVMLEANFLSEKLRRATGDGGEENEDWIPKVDKNGKVSYEMEEGDSIKTLQSQFGLTETEAQQLMPADLKPGEAISGTAAKFITGSEVLKLDLSNKNKDLTDADIVYQGIFAVRHSFINDIKKVRAGIKPKWYFNLNNYFSGITEFTDWNSGGALYGIQNKRPVNILVNNTNIEIISFSISTTTNRLINSNINGIIYYDNGNKSRLEFYHPSAWHNRPKSGIKSMRLPTMAINIKSKYDEILYDYLNPNL